MGLDMYVKRALTREIRRDYRTAGKKEKTVMLDHIVKLTGYNRKYAVRVLSEKSDARATIAADGKTVIVKPEKKSRPKNRLGKSVYTRETITCLEGIWHFYRHTCGLYLAEIIKQNIEALVSNTKQDFHIKPEIREQLTTISGRHIDRLLKPAKAALRLRGISGTKAAGTTLLKQIPVRTHYTEHEAGTPGYCQTDTVHHCGDRDSGQFNLTLTVTDVASGWIWLYGLLNKAHRWTLENLRRTYETSVFTIIEFHSDCGSEFINKDTIDWWKVTETLLLTHSRSYHKNDNCYAEQKNNAFVRNVVGYWRYDTQAELDALNLVYHYLCPLVNFFCPNKKLLNKKRDGAKIIKTYATVLKTPYQRLMEPAVSQEVKNNLTAERERLNSVDLQYNLTRQTHENMIY